MLRLLYVYKFASFGGVERVLLNRAEAFKKHGIAVKISLYFLEDFGALNSINNYIKVAQLTEYLTVVKDIRETEYDYIISIDTPEILKYQISSEKLLFECHTTYINSRLYLYRLPDNVRSIVVPSRSMKLGLAEEIPELESRIVVVRNFVPSDSISVENPFIFWNKRPLLYLGRMDKHKNVSELLDVFECYRSTYGDDLMLFLVGMVDVNINLPEELRLRNLVDRTVVFPPVQFDRVKQIYSLVKEHEGVFISSSQDEACPMSVAEALTNELPVLLSGIDAHVDYVQADIRFLYPLGDAFAGARKLRNLVENYDTAVKNVANFKRQFSEESFLSDWQNFITLLQ